MVLVLAGVLICAAMFGIYAIFRTEEHHLVERPGPNYKH